VIVAGHSGGGCNSKGGLATAVQASAKVPPVEQVTPAAEKKLDVSAKITRMEQEAIAADPQASAAKARMVELNEMLTGMRKQAQTGGARYV